MLDIQDDLDTIQIEAELLDELDDLERNYSTSSDNSNSPPISLLRKGLTTIGCQAESPDLNSKAEEKAESILCSIPGYELFKESADVSSATCVATLQTIYSINEELFDGRCFAEDRGGTASTDKSINDIETGNDGDSLNMEQHEKDHDVDENEKTKNIIESNSFHPQHEENVNSTETLHQNGVNHHQIKNSTMDNMIFLDSLLEDHHEKLFVMEKVQEKIEIEAKEEQLSQKRKRSENNRKRVMDATKERQLCLAQSKSAPCIQRVLRENLRRRKFGKVRAIYKGFLQASSLEEYWSTKQSFLMLVEYTLQMRMALKIQTHLHDFMQKRRRRKKLLRTMMKNLVDGIFLKRTFLFWTVYTSTMQMQERLMLELKNSVVIMQNAFRRYRAKCLLRQLKEAYHSTVIQRHFRGYQARRIFHERREINERKRYLSALSIQKLYRGYKARDRLSRAIGANYSYVDGDIDRILTEEVEEADCILDEIILTMESDQSSTTEWRPCKPTIKINHHDPKRSTIDVTGTKYHESSMKEDVRKEECIPKICSPKHHYEGEQSKSDIMNEWKISDQRIVEAMLKRKARMIRGKRKEERAKLLSNPVNRFKRLMKNVGKQRRKVYP